MRHPSQEQTSAAGRLKDVSTLKTQALQRTPDRLHHRQRGVVSVQRAGCCRAEFLRGEEFFKLCVTGLPRSVAGSSIKRLDQAAPTCVQAENCMLLRGSAATFLLQLTQELDGSNVRFVLRHRSADRIMMRCLQLRPQGLWLDFFDDLVRRNSGAVERSEHFTRIFIWVETR